ncbi:MAG TPA: FAD-binding protein, partial [Acidilobales archaeon]|nr:FAD-binding protein [Acidilobales archaeon]
MSKDLRIYEHPILDFKRGKKVKFYFEGRVIEAYSNESILASLYAIGIKVFSWSTKLHRPRGAFCMIGKCSSCLAYIDGIPNRRLCIEPSRDGIVVERQRGIPKVNTSTNISDEEVNIEELRTDLLIIGGGPAGLQAALKASNLGMDIILVDEGLRLGGQLVKQTHKFFGIKRYYGGLRGFEIAEKLSKKIKELENVRVFTSTSVYGYFRGGVIGAYSRLPKPLNLIIKPKAVIVATGAMERYLEFENNDLPGIMGAGAAQTLMNQYGIRPGDNALIIG